jgi:hypothetical protein
MRRTVAARRIEVDRIRDYYNSVYGVVSSHIIYIILLLLLLLLLLYCCAVINNIVTRTSYIYAYCRTL